MYTIKRLSEIYKPKLLEHLSRLDLQSVYDRFCIAANKEFLERYTNQINFRTSGIYGVFDQELKMIGLGECVIYKENIKEAEVAFSIEREHQGKGLGNKLMKKLIQFAKANNIDKLNMYCLKTNTKSLHLAKKYGLNLTYEKDEVAAIINMPTSPSIVHQSYEVADEIIASIEIAHKTNSKLWKIQDNYQNLMKTTFSKPNHNKLEEEIN